MQKALKIDPEFAMAHRSVAMSYSNIGMVPAMKKALEKAFELRHRVSERERYIIEGDYYRTSWRTDAKAMQAYQNLLKLYPEDSIGNTNLGILYLDMEDYDKALKHFKLSMHAWNISEVYAAMGLYDEALEAIENHIRDNPDHSRYHIKIASYLLYHGEYNRALAELDTALSFPSQDFGVEWGAELLKGHAYLLKGDLDAAEDEYLKLKGRAGDAPKRSSLALISLLKGQFEEAKKQLTKKPVLTEPLIFLYLRTGQSESALKALDEVWNTAVSADDRFLQLRVLHAKGLALVQMRKLDEALKIASELRSLIQDWINKKDIRLYHQLMGLIEYEKGELVKAINSLKTAVDMLYAPNDGDPEYHTFFFYTLGQAYFRAGDLENAEDEYLKIISLARGRLQNGDFYAKSFFMLGKIYEQKGSKEKAIENYETFLDMWRDADPGLSEVDEARKSLAELK
jgi:tetratricopeptide (TPR) repeat protein